MHNDMANFQKLWHNKHGYMASFQKVGHKYDVDATKFMCTYVHEKGIKRIRRVSYPSSLHLF